MPDTETSLVADARTLCVFCGSSRGVSPSFEAVARDLGSELAHRGVRLVYGGARVGLMGAVADAALAAGGEVIGVMPAHLVDHEVAHERVTRLEVTTSMHERKARMVELSDGVIALPGGLGTFEEVFEVLTWNQLGLVAMPVVMLDVDGFYARLFSLLDHAVDAGFIRSSHRGLAQRAETVTAAVDCALDAPMVDLGRKWVD